MKLMCKENEREKMKQIKECGCVNSIDLSKNEDPVSKKKAKLDFVVVKLTILNHSLSLTNNITTTGRCNFNSKFTTTIFSLNVQISV